MKVLIFFQQLDQIKLLCLNNWDNFPLQLWTFALSRDALQFSLKQRPQCFSEMPHQLLLWARVCERFNETLVSLVYSCRWERCHLDSESVSHHSRIRSNNKQGFMGKIQYKHTNSPVKSITFPSKRRVQSDRFWLPRLPLPNALTWQVDMSDSVQ